MKNKIKGISMILGTILLVVGVVFGAYYTLWYSAEPIGELEAKQKIESGKNRIDKYNKFFDVCSEIQTKEDMMRNMQSNLETTTNEDYKNRLRRNLNAIKNQCNSLVNQYNQDARKSYTAGQFRASKLPYQIDNACTRESHTSCAR